MKYLITGVNRGIGLAFVKALAANKENFVYGTVRGLDQAKELLDLKLDNVKLIVIDVVQSLEEIKEAFKAIDYVDVVISNAAATSKKHFASLLEQEILDYNHTLQVNTVGFIKLYQAAYPYLFNGKGDKKKMIVGISTVAADLATVDQFKQAFNGYGASKIAMNYSVKQIAYDHARSDDEVVRNSVAFTIEPGIVDTGIVYDGIDMSAFTFITPDESVAQLLQLFDKCESGKNYTKDGVLL